MDGGSAMSLAVAMAGVVVVEAGGGGDVSRVGLSGGEGAKISLGGGGATRICVCQPFISELQVYSLDPIERATYLMREIALFRRSDQGRHVPHSLMTKSQNLHQRSGQSSRVVPPSTSGEGKSDQMFLPWDQLLYLGQRPTSRDRVRRILPL